MPRKQEQREPAALRQAHLVASLSAQRGFPTMWAPDARDTTAASGSTNDTKTRTALTTTTMPTP